MSLELTIAVGTTMVGLVHRILLWPADTWRHMRYTGFFVWLNKYYRRTKHVRTSTWADMSSTGLYSTRVVWVCNQLVEPLSTRLKIAWAALVRRHLNFKTPSIFRLNIIAWPGLIWSWLLRTRVPTQHCLLSCFGMFASWLLRIYFFLWLKVGKEHLKDVLMPSVSLRKQKIKDRRLQSLVFHVCVLPLVQYLKVPSSWPSTDL
jgi:hypothetical protein